LSDYIQTAYRLSKEDKKVIKDNFSTHKDWEKGVFEKFKESIKAYLRVEQNNQCCYCKNELGFDVKQVDIEHIIPKSEYEKFTFYPKNLALSCPACNTIKSTNSVLKKSSITNYPSSKTNFKIIHAHYDEYSKNIRIEDNCIYIPKTKKGSETITICKLFRLEKVESNARKFITKKSPLTELIESIRTSESSELENLLDLLKEQID